MADLEAFAVHTNMMNIEKAMLEYEQVNCPLTHIFSGGIYIRQIQIPAGTMLMGERHRNETCNILMSGVLDIYVSEDEPPKRITGPYLFTSPAKAKKMAMCIEDAIFANIFPTDETDVDSIEAKVIITEEEYVKELKGA